MKKGLVAVLIVAVLGVFIFVAMHNIKKSEETTGVPRNAYPVEIEEVGVKTIVSSVSAKGTVRLVDIFSVYPRTDGIIERVFFKEGDYINSGDIIMTYSDDTLKNLRDQIDDLNLQLKAANLRLAEATLPASETEVLSAQSMVNQSAKDIEDINIKIAQTDEAIEVLNSDIESARLSLADIETLYSVGGATKQEVEQARESIAKLEVQLSAKQRDNQALLLTLSAAQENLSLNERKYESVLNRSGDQSVENTRKQTEISIEQIRLKITQLEKEINDFVHEDISEVSGTIISFLPEEGAMVSRSAQIMEVAQIEGDNLIITVDIPESDASELYEGLDAEISAPILGKETVSGTITKIHPIAEQRQLSGSLETVIKADIEFSDPTGKLRAGNSVNVEIVTRESEDALVVPLMATFSEGDGSDYVYVMNEDYTISKRAIEMIAFSGLWVEVSGVSLGERIVQSPVPQLHDGSYVKPIIRMVSQ